MEYLDLSFLHENESLDCDGLISDNGGSATSLPSDGGLKISGTEGESEAKWSDWKSLATKGTMAMIGCAFLEVQVQEELIVELGDVDGIEDVGDESTSVEQEGFLEEANAEHKVEEEALVEETLSTKTQHGQQLCSTTHLQRCAGILENLNCENLFHCSLVPIFNDIANLKGNSTFSSFSCWNKSLNLQGPRTSMRPNI